MCVGWPRKEVRMTTHGVLTSQDGEAAGSEGEVELIVSFQQITCAVLVRHHMEVPRRQRDVLIRIHQATLGRGRGSSFVTCGFL